MSIVSVKLLHGVIFEMNYTDKTNGLDLEREVFHQIDIEQNEKTTGVFRYIYRGKYLQNETLLKDIIIPNGGPIFVMHRGLK
eukprot:gene11520-4684_t